MGQRFETLRGVPTNNTKSGAGKSDIRPAPPVVEAGDAPGRVSVAVSAGCSGMLPLASEIGQSRECATSSDAFCPTPESRVTNI